jgi:hypothetical protein
MVEIVGKSKVDFRFFIRLGFPLLRPFGYVQGRLFSLRTGSAGMTEISSIEKNGDLVDAFCGCALVFSYYFLAVFGNFLGKVWFTEAFLHCV